MVVQMTRKGDYTDSFLRVVHFFCCNEQGGVNLYWARAHQRALDNRF